jgi:predicted RecB family nuclease
MPLTAAQVTAFFTDAAQMGIPNATVVQLQEEGINSIDDLVDFDKDTIEQIAANL